MLTHARAVLFLFLTFIGWGFSGDLNAQESETNRTILEIEILMPRIGGDPLMAQRWGDAFQKLGEGVRIRQMLGSDKADIVEKMQGRYRIVNLTGELERSGKLLFPKRTFSLEQTAQLAEWLKELKTYGAQGTPEGQPNWGMTKPQFDAVVKGLSDPIEKPIKGLTLEAAIAAIQLPEEFPLVFHASCDPLLKDLKEVPLLLETEGLSKGTSLAAVLSQYGMGFTPLRRPDGGVDLRVQPLREITKPWAVGWPLDPVQPRNQLMPAMFQMAQTGFDDLVLQDVLQAISAQGKIPVVINQAACLAKEIDPKSVKVSHDYKKTAPALVLRSVVRRSKLNFEYRLDDAGRPFVYVFPFVPVISPQ